MESVQVGAVMVQTTSHTTTTGVLAVLTDTTVTGRNVSSLLAVLGETSRLNGWGRRECVIGLVASVDDENDSNSDSNISNNINNSNIIIIINNINNIINNNNKNS